MSLQTMISTEAANNFGALVEYALKGGATVIQRYKRNAAVLIGFDEYDRLKRAEAELLNRRSQEIKNGNYVSWEEVENALGT